MININKRNESKSKSKYAFQLLRQNDVIPNQEIVKAMMRTKNAVIDAIIPKPTCIHHILNPHSPTLGVILIETVKKVVPRVVL